MVMATIIKWWNVIFPPEDGIWGAKRPLRGQSLKDVKILEPFWWSRTIHLRPDDDDDDVMLNRFLFPYSFYFLTGVTTGTHNHPKNSEPTRRKIFMGKPDSTGTLKPLPSGETPTVFLKKWLDTETLTRAERKLFREYSDDPENLLSTNQKMMRSGLLHKTQMPRTTRMICVRIVEKLKDESSRNQQQFYCSMTIEKP